MPGSQLTRLVPPGILYSWGDESDWRRGIMPMLGYGRPMPEGPQPTLGFMAAVSAAAGRHSLMALADGTVWSVGANDSRDSEGHGSPPMDYSGQLGRGGGPMAGRVMGLLTAKVTIQVAVGRYHSAALSSDGQVFTWGLNDWGQLGRGGVDRVPATPTMPAFYKNCTHGTRCHDGRPGLVELPRGGFGGVGRACVIVCTVCLAA
jgi:alpha-tubulin suppressor-like RCC1 family protein